MKNLALILLLIPTILKSQSPLETEFLKQLNSYRDSLGLSKLEYDSNLSIAAKHLVDYKITAYKTLDKKFVDTAISHYENIDLPDFKEIVTPSERVAKLTNFEIAKREVAKGGFIIDEVTTSFRPLDKPGFTTIINGSKFPSGDICKDRSLNAFQLLKGLKKSKFHNFAITDPGKGGLKVGISIINGILVMVYGYEK
jgi:hypothetical protein